DYNLLLEKQQHKCGICGTHEKDLPKALCVDHDHVTGEVRGLLCTRCNRALGFLQDSFSTVQKAADYLNPIKHSKKDVVSLDRRAFLSTMQLMSAVMQAMGDEFESFRVAKGAMDPELRKAMMQLTGAHLQNVSTISHALQASLFDPMDPDGTKGRDLN